MNEFDKNINDYIDSSTGLTKGAYTYGNPIRRGTGNKVTIGKFCSIAEGVIFDGGFSHNTNNISTFPFHTFVDSSLESNIVIKGDINIGNDVWLGEQSVIMSGVTIGHGAVIGMRAIISKNVPPYAIVVGAPQRILRMRFDPDRIKKLLDIAWWDFSESDIILAAPLLQSNDIDKFIKVYGK